MGSVKSCGQVVANKKSISFFLQAIIYFLVSTMSLAGHIIPGMICPNA